MFSYYLQDRSYYFANDSEVITHIQSLSKIISEADSNDHFFKSSMFEEGKYDRWNNIGEVFDSDRMPNSIKKKIWPSIKKRCKEISIRYMSIADMNNDRLNSSNAFLGPKFYRNSVGLIVGFDEYITFRAIMTTRIVDGNNFGKCCGIMLKKVIVTKDAIDQVKSLGEDVRKVFIQLVEFDSYLRDNWKKGAIRLKDIKDNTTLDISDESDTVKRTPKTKRLRYFKIPGIGGRYCFVHIKQDNLRFHIYADEEEGKVYVPYIGAHLELA